MTDVCIAQDAAAAEAGAGSQKVLSAGTPAPPQRAPAAPKRKREESFAWDNTGADELSFEEVSSVSLERLEPTCLQRACLC